MSRLVRLNFSAEQMSQNKLVIQVSLNYTVYNAAFFVLGMLFCASDLLAREMVAEEFVTPVSNNQNDMTPLYILNRYRTSGLQSWTNS